jgi:2-keto-4-pentenoate hydratase
VSLLFNRDERSDVSPLWDDRRVAEGMAAQLQRREERLAAGERPLGWKVAFSAPAAMANLNIEAPLIGFLTDRALVSSGAEYSLEAWVKPALEPEIAIHMADDLPAGSDRDAAAASIGGLGAAIELADVDSPPEDVRHVVATNIFQRGVILGPVDESRRGGDATGIVARVYDDDVLVAEQADPCAVVGDLVEVTRHVADLLGAFGSGLSAGDVIISGSVVPLLWVEPGQHIRLELEPLGQVDVRLVDHAAAAA